MGLSFRLLPALWLLALALAGCQQLQDRLDQRAVRRQFGICDCAELVFHEGFPYMNGFGQREGLQLRTTFQIDPEDRDIFEGRARSSGWTDLPVPSEVWAHIPLRGLEMDQAEEGLFFCRTAGDDVLNTPTRPCLEEVLLRDILFGVYNRETGTITTVIRSGD